MVLVDSGNALFRAPGLTDDASKARAEFILGTMGKLGTAAMAAGARDLVLGVDFLKQTAARSKVLVLSSNLVGADGKHLFPGSTVVDAGGVLIGLVGVSPVGPVDKSPGVQGKAAAPEVMEEVKRLKGRADAVVVLAAMPYADVLQLSRALGPTVDVLLQSHDARGAGAPQRLDGNFVLFSGERGKQLAKLELSLAGKGPLLNLEEVDRNRRTLELLDKQVSDVRDRIGKTTDPAGRAGLEDALASFLNRQKTLKENMGIDRPRGRRTLRLSFVPLGADVADDPAIKAEADRYDTAGAH